MFNLSGESQNDKVSRMETNWCIQDGRFDQKSFNTVFYYDYYDYDYDGYDYDGD